MLVSIPDMLQNVYAADMKLASNAQTTVLVDLDSASTAISANATRDIHTWLNYITQSTIKNKLREPTIDSACHSL